MTNHEYEKTLLSMLMMDCRIYYEHTMSAELFSKPEHRKILGLILDMYATGKTDRHTGKIDIMLAAEKARHEDVSLALLSELHDSLVSTANAKLYIEELDRLYKLREFQRMAMRVTDVVKYPDKSETIIEDVSGIISETLHNVTSKGARDYRASKEIIYDTIEMIQAKISDPDYRRGIATGFDSVDMSVAGFRKQELIIIGARPSLGKTSLMTTMAMHQVHNGERVGMFSCEMSETQLMERLVSAWARIDPNLFKPNSLTASQLSKVADAAGYFRDANLWIDDTPNIKIDKLMTNARRMKLVDGITILYIDYITLINHHDKRLPRHERVGEISKMLKELARELEIPIVCLSQLGRDAEGVRPELKHLRQSGEIEEDADVVIFLHRERAHDVGRIDTQLLWEKDRNGPIGEFTLKFQPSHTRFYDT